MTPNENNQELQSQAAEPEELNQFEAEDAPEMEQVEYTWEASEYLHHEKSGKWYLLFFLAIGILIGIAVLFKQWFSIPVFIAMAAALLVYAKKPPRVLQYRVDETGVTVGDKHYPYELFRSFSVMTDIAWHSIDLEPTRRFMARLTMMFDNDDLDKIVAILSKELPLEQRNPDLIDRLGRYLKF